MKISASLSCLPAGSRWCCIRSRSTSAAVSSFCDVTEMYSPVAMENAPAIRPAMPVSTIAPCPPPPPPIPAISEELVTSPSIAPNTAGRSQPPDTSRCSRSG